MAFEEFNFTGGSQGVASFISENIDWFDTVSVENDTVVCKIDGVRYLSIDTSVSFWPSGDQGDQSSNYFSVTNFGDLSIFNHAYKSKNGIVLTRNLESVQGRWIFFGYTNNGIKCVAVSGVYNGDFQYMCIGAFGEKSGPATGVDAGSINCPIIAPNKGWLKTNQVLPMPIPTHPNKNTGISYINGACILAISPFSTGSIALTDGWHHIVIDGIEYITDGFLALSDV